MADRSIVVRLKAEVGDFKRQMAQSAQSAQDFGKRTQDAITKNSAHINTLSNTAGLLGLALTASAAAAVKTFADFDQAMSSVQAATMESAENMDLLREAAIEAGAETSFSAGEAADAIEQLAKAGVSTADILAGGLSGALDLAASDNIAVADAAEIAASAMTQFGLAGEDVTHIADLLAAGAGKAQGGVLDLGQALNQSGLVASQMGLSIEETAGSLAAFASAGLVGSDAGTSFRAMLLRLANPTDEAADKMAELGIQAYDAQGGFVGMESLAGQLQDRLGGLTQEQRNAALALIFGQDAIRTSSILYKQGAEGVREWTEAVDEQGYASQQAATRLDNLKGDLEELGGSFETAMIRLGESGDAPLRGLVQAATEVVNTLGELPPAAQAATLGIVGGGGLVLLGVAGLGKLVVGVNEARLAMESLKISSKTAALAAGGVGAALGVAAVGLMVWAQNAAEARARTEEFQGTLDEFGKTTDATLSKINEELSKNQNDWIDNLFGKDPQSRIDQAKKFGLAVEDLQGYILGQADAVAKVNAAMEEYVGTSFAMTSEERERERVTQSFRGSLDGLAGSLTEAEKAQAQKAAADEAAGIAQEELGGAYGETTNAIGEQIQTLGELIAAQAEAAGVVLSERDAQRAFEAALDDATAALEENGATLDVSTEKGRANQQALDDIASAGYDVIASMEANGATQEELQGVMATTRERFVAAATAMGMGADEANNLANELGLIPSSVKTVVTVVDEASPKLDLISTKIWSLPSSRTLTINTVTKENTVTSGRGNTIARAAGGLVTGPGTATSDSIPARLSNGEYVIKAASVSRYGKAFFDGLNAQRFATGGYVGVASAAPAAASVAVDGDSRPIEITTQVVLDSRVVAESIRRHDRSVR